MEQDAAARERLRTLVGNWGREVVRLKLELGEVELDEVLSGEYAMDAHTRQRFVDVWRELAGGDDPEDLDPALIAEEEERVWKRDEEGDEEEGDEEEGDGGVEEHFPSPSQSSATPEVVLEEELSTRPGMASREQQERIEMSLMDSHLRASLAQYGQGASPGDKVNALIVTVKLEVALITHFRQSFPEAGHTRVAERRAREIEKRQKRLRLLERGRDQHYFGRRIPSDEEVYQRIIELSEPMILAMEIGSDPKVIEVIEAMRALRVIRPDNQGH